MCFSATASFIAGGVLSATGIVTIRKAKTKAEVPFASIPLLFGIQQLIEGVVWLSFGNQLLNSIATNSFLAFALVLWPVFVPTAVLLIEANKTRKKLLTTFVFIGASVGLYLLYTMFVGPYMSHTANMSISYHSPHIHLYLVSTFYLLATCGSPLISSHKIIRIFGIVVLISAGIATWFYTQTFLSVWCFFAAIVSLIVYLYFFPKDKK